MAQHTNRGIEMTRRLPDDVSLAILCNWHESLGHEIMP